MRDNRRRHLRIYRKTSIVVRRATGAEVKAVAVDVSLGGCRFTSAEGFAVGDSISARLPFADNIVYGVEGEIVNVSSAGDVTRYHVKFSERTTRMLEESFEER